MVSSRFGLVESRDTLTPKSSSTLSHILLQALVIDQISLLEFLTNPYVLHKLVQFFWSDSDKENNQIFAFILYPTQILISLNHQYIKFC